MIRLRQVKLSVNAKDELKKKCANRLNINIKNIKSLKIIKRSLDARKKPNLFYVYEVDIDVENEEYILKNNKDNDIFKTPVEKYDFKVTGDIKLNNNPIIVGSGPAGLFCAYLLSLNGYNPIIIERGECVCDRVKTVEAFFKTGKLNPNSNVQFGEGGAGTFSDGKLNTLVKDKKNRIKFILETLVKFGAPEEILYDSKPHIGTDVLRKVVTNLRNEIIKNGGEFLYDTCLTNVNIANGKIISIEVNNEICINCDLLVLALGHSARDTFQMLYDKGIQMESKPFAVGIRIQHPQKLINDNQYGILNYPMEAASYKLTYKASNNRGVYSFCMCPGGYVVNASSEDNMLAINGMSNYKRDTINANSAIIVTVNKNDFGNHPLAGIEFQRNLERNAYKYGAGKIPVQLLKDFKCENISTKFESVKPIIQGDYEFADINKILPKYICDALKEGIEYFDTKIKGFASNDAILAAVESRTSSPVRILRDDTLVSNIKGIYPIGEGAGYAGGITSAAIDGMRCAEMIANNYYIKKH